MAVGKKLAIVGVVAAALYALNQQRKARASPNAKTSPPLANAPSVNEPKPPKQARSKSRKRARAVPVKRARTV